MFAFVNPHPPGLLVGFLVRVWLPMLGISLETLDLQVRCKYIEGFIGGCIPELA